MNIIARAGAAIATHLEEAKSILSKHNISYGNGKIKDVILASFSAIKQGNKELVNDLAGLISVKEKADKIKSPEDKKAFILEKINQLRDKIKSRVTAKKGQQLGYAPRGTNGPESPSSADGSEEQSIANELIDAIEKQDPVEATKEALPAKAGKSIIVIIVVIIVIALAVYLIKKQ